MTSELLNLREFVSGSHSALKVDRDKGIIFGVKILGEASQNPPPNNNTYPRKTRERVSKAIEGTRVYVDHSQDHRGNTERSYRDSFGTLLEVQEKGDGLYADYHFPPKHPLAEQLFWDAEHAPSNLGFSISSEGRGKVEGGRRIIEEICFDRMRHSVDLVSRPATTQGLFESLKGKTMKKVKELIESLKTTRPGFSRALREMAEAGIMSPEVDMAEPVEAPADDTADHELALKQGFRGAIVAVVDDDSLDMKAKMAKIKEIMKAEEKLLGGGKEEPAESETPADSGESKTEESMKTKTADLLIVQEAFNLRLKARDMCADAGVTPTEWQRRALDSCKNEADIKACIESMKASKPQQTRASGSTAWVDTQGNGLQPVKESANGNGQPQFTDEDRKRRVQEARRS